MTTLFLSLLGPFQVTLDGDPIAELTSAKARALLAYLAVEAHRPHPRPALASLFWPDHPEPRARANLSQALFLLRAALDDHPASPPLSRSAPGRPMVGRPPEADATPTPILLATAQTMQFNPAMASIVDVIRFTSSLDKCARHPHARLELCPACLERLQQAVPLYRGRFLEDLSVGDSAPYEEWATLTREHLQNRAVEALHSLAEGLSWRGEYERALAYARRQVELDPWREEAQRQVMRLLALSGRRSEALMQYETCRRLLAEIHSGAFEASAVAALTSSPARSPSPRRPRGRGTGRKPGWPRRRRPITLR
jgi:DNA-binding SARP family transcriptional activator